MKRSIILLILLELMIPGAVATQSAVAEHLLKLRSKSFAALDVTDLQDERQGSEPRCGIQFVYGGDKSIEEVFRSSKILLGNYRFSRSENQHVVAMIHNPAFNYQPQELFGKREVKIATPLKTIEPAKFRNTVVLRELGDGTYELIGYYSDIPAAKNKYLVFSNRKELFGFGKQIFLSVKYRYEKLVELLISKLNDENPDQALKVIYRLRALGNEAAPAIGPIQRRAKQFENPHQVAGSVLSLLEMGGKTAVGPLLPHAMPRLAKGIRSKNTTVQQKCLIACRLVGPPARDAIPSIVDVIHELVERQRNQPSQSMEELEYVVVPMISALSAIDGAHELSIKTFQGLQDHESSVIQKAAQKALQRR